MPRDRFVRDELRVVPDVGLTPGEKSLIDLASATLGTDRGPLVFDDVTTDGAAIKFYATYSGIVAVVDDEDVGAFAYGTNYVSPDHRGRGIGSSLLIAAMMDGMTSPSHFSESGKRARISARRRLAELAVERTPYGSWPSVVTEYDDLIPGFEVLRQPDGITCGPTSAVMAIDWLNGVRPNVFDMADAMGTDAITGTTDVRMARGLDMHGVRWSRRLESEEDPVRALKQVIAGGKAVVALRTLSLGKHWVLAYASTRAGVLIACPATGIKFWSDEICRRHWGARDYHSFTIER